MSLPQRANPRLGQGNGRLGQGNGRMPPGNGRLNQGNGRMAQPGGRNGLPQRGVFENRVVENSNGGGYLQRLQHLAEQQHHQVRQQRPVQHHVQQPPRQVQHQVQQRHVQQSQRRAPAVDREKNGSDNSPFSLFGGNSLFGGSGSSFVGGKSTKSMWGGLDMRSSSMPTAGALGGERLVERGSSSDVSPIGPGAYKGNKRSAYAEKHQGNNEMWRVGEVVMASGFLESSFMEEKLGFLGRKNEGNAKRQNNDHFGGINELREGSEEIASFSNSRRGNGHVNDGRAANNDGRDYSPFAGNSLGFLGTIGPREKNGRNGQPTRQNADSFLDAKDPFLGNNEQPNLSWL